MFGAVSFNIYAGMVDAFLICKCRARDGTVSRNSGMLYEAACILFYLASAIEKRLTRNLLTVPWKFIYIKKKSWNMHTTAIYTIAMPGIFCV